MQNLFAWSSTRTYLLVVGRMAVAALSLLVLEQAGCRDTGSPSDTTMDLAMPTDLAQAPGMLHDVTIRDLNDPMTTLKDGDRVRFTGVVISPQGWITYDAKGPDWCYYRVFVMQADGTPTTLRDGMALTLSLKTTFGDMSHYSECSALGQQDAVATALMAAKLGDVLKVEGRYSHYGKGATATRQIDVYKGVITDQGAAQMMPVPLDADPMTYTPQAMGLTQAFVDAQGVLVTFKNVKTNSRDPMYQDFSVSTTDMGGARMAANYLRAADTMYMSPADGTTLQSVTGIVTGDFKGTIWPRSTADIKQ